MASNARLFWPGNVFLSMRDRPCPVCQEPVWSALAPHTDGSGRIVVVPLCGHIRLATDADEASPRDEQATDQPQRDRDA